MGRPDAMYSKSFSGDVYAAYGIDAEVGSTRMSMAATRRRTSDGGTNPTRRTFDIAAARSPSMS